MNTRPSELKRLFKAKGITKKFFADKFNIPQEYVSHALNPNSPRAKTAKILKTREQIYTFLTSLNIN